MLYPSPSLLLPELVFRNTTAQAPANLRPFNHLEADFFCNAHLAGKCSAGNVEGRFGQQQVAAAFQAIVNLAQQAALIGHFVKHRKAEREVGLGIDPEPIPLALDGSRCGRPLPPFPPPPQHVEHLPLEIHGDHFAAVANHAGHGDREPAHAAAHVQHGHAGLDVWPDDLLRIVKPAPQRNVDRQ